MNYLLDKKLKRKKFSRSIIAVVLIFILFYFRLSIFNGLSYLSHTVFRPVLTTGNYIGSKLSNAKSFLIFKSSLYQENENLKSQLAEYNARMANYESVLAENISLKEILSRKSEKTNMILSAILSKPSQSLYDILIIDTGANTGVKVGDMVFAFGYVPIGKVSEVFPNSSKVILFSNSGEKTQVVVPPKNVFMEAIGRGGGNFEMILPRDLVLLKGDQIVLPGITPRVLAVVQTIISDPRDPFQKALLVSPINIQELKFVEVEV